ncbi:MAG: hypothetical protein A3E83_00510 [Gammaproteobacteria bacterium RIFCSPHIGHO2_12_FULL_41_20]|nr:MAG: hypothetical protein A3E83_00510 [Gammaproteobacteria bacterium RIFCSPHIGHO2_12_FULL_41_20]
MKKLVSLQRQQGYFLFIAVIFILVIGIMGSLIAYMFSNKAPISVAEQNGLKAFYIAESGLEIGARLLTMPNITGTPIRLACSSITGSAAITNASLGDGTFTITTINSSPIYTMNTLSAAISSSVTTIPVSGISGFASQGRIMIDRELMDYASISGNSFIEVTRGTGGTTAASHANSTSISQYQCSFNIQSGIPNLTSPVAQRNIQTNVQLQEGWTVGNRSGNNFVLSRWNRPTEIAWTNVTVAGGNDASNLNSVNMLSNAEAWAVGNRTNNHLIFLHWNGSAWSLSTLTGCSGQDLLGVSAVSSQEAWATGVRYRENCAGSGPRRYTIARWDGSTWSLLTPASSPSIPADNTSNQTLNAIHVIDTDNDGIGNIGFAVGDNGTILQYDGSNWTSATSPVTNNLFGVYAVSATEAWAVGASGRILKWNGSSWSTVTSPVTTTLNAIKMVDTDGDGTANFGLVAANSGRILSYNGSTWSFVDLGGTNLFSVDIINQNDAWVAGASGTTMHWDGSTWTEIESGTNNRLNGISVIGPAKNPNFTWKQVFG